MAGLGRPGTRPTDISNPSKPPLSRNKAAARTSMWWQVRFETTADSDGLDHSGEAAAIVRFEKDAAQGSLTIGYLRALAGHLADETAYRRCLLHPDYRIIVAAHPGIGLVCRAARQYLRIGCRHMRVGPEYGGDAAIREMAQRHLLARRLGVKIDEDRGDILAEPITR